MTSRRPASPATRGMAAKAQTIRPFGMVGHIMTLALRNLRYGGYHG